MVTFVLLLLLLLAATMLFVIVSEFVAFVRTRVPFVPTRAGDIKFIVEKLGITSNDVFYDLGSGNGKVVFMVNKLSGATCVGFELSWWTVLFAKVKSKFWNSPLPSLMQREGVAAVTSSFQKRGTGGVKFHCKNFFKQDWSGANYIYAYLYPPLMGRVRDKFLAECKPGAVAIIRDFFLPGLKPEATYSLPKKHEIFIYKKV